MAVTSLRDGSQDSTEVAFHHGPLELQFQCRAWGLGFGFFLDRGVREVELGFEFRRSEGLRVGERQRSMIKGSTCGWPDDPRLPA